MNTQLLEQIRQSMESKSTEELLDMWLKHDTRAWSEEAFEAAQEVLAERPESARKGLRRLAPSDAAVPAERSSEHELTGKLTNSFPKTVIQLCLPGGESVRYSDLGRLKQEIWKGKIKGDTRARAFNPAEELERVIQSVEENRNESKQGQPQWSTLGQILAIDKLVASIDPQVRLCHGPVDGAKIRAVVRDGAVRRAAGSLAFWGCLNLAAWLLLSGNTRDLLAKFNHAGIEPTAGIYLLVYGPLILGCAMLVFSALGWLTRSPVTIALDGLALIGVGLWNLYLTLMQMEQWTNGGNRLEIYFWAVLGWCQIVWGGRQLSAFRRIKAWWCADMSRQEKRALKQELHSFVRLKDTEEPSVINAKLKLDAPPGLEGFALTNFLSRTVNFTGRLSDDSVTFLSSTLDDFFWIKRTALSQAKFSPTGVRINLRHAMKDLSLGELSLENLKKWCEKS